MRAATLRAATFVDTRRLGLELTRVMVLQYSNQETSVTIGESVRDEDGIYPFSSLQGLRLQLRWIFFCRR